MYNEIDRRDFLKLSGVTMAGIAALAGGATSITFDPTPAYAAAYGAESSKVVSSRALLNARINEITWNGKTINVNDTQALAIDPVNKRYYMTKNYPSAASRVAIFSAPMSAKKLEDWQLVKVFDKSWLKHANSLCCVSCGKGTKLVVATDSRNLRVIYIPDASQPSKNLQTSTWVCDKFKPRGISYLPSKQRFVARNGISTKSGQKYVNCFTFEMPTTEVTGTVHIPSYLAKFQVEIPSSVTAPAGVFGDKEYSFAPSSWARQDSAYDGTYYYMAFSSTKANRYYYVDKKGKKHYATSRNVLLRWEVGDTKAIYNKYKANKKKAWRYPFDCAIFDGSVDSTLQGYEFEGLDVLDGKLYLLTNESSHHLKNKDDSVRIIDL